MKSAWLGPLLMITLAGSLATACEADEGAGELQGTVTGARCVDDSDCEGEVTVDGDCLQAACVAGRCATGPGREGEACDDGVACTYDDLCVSGACLGTSYSCAGAAACMGNSCDGLGGCTAAATPGTCEIDSGCYNEGDGHPENLCLTCRPEVDARGWTEPRCENSDPCTTNACDPTTGACVSEPRTLDVAETCNGEDDNCDGVVDEGFPDHDDDGLADCVDTDADGDGAEVPADCDDFDDEVFPGAPEACDGLDNDCDPATGDGEGACDDGNVCTQDACVDGACTTTPDDQALPDDGHDCTLDSCSGGQAQHTPDHGHCDDAEPCSLDTCDPSAGCVHGNNPAHIPDDGIPCTDDACVNGQPVHAPDHGLCADDLPCTDDVCAPGVGCTFPVDDTNPCEDGTCRNGACCVGTSCCPAGMTINPGLPVCTGIWEASRADATGDFEGVAEGPATSRPGVLPWIYVDHATAAAACEAAGGRLCERDELENLCGGPAQTSYVYGDDYEPTTCNTYEAPDFAAVATGQYAGCTNSWGIYDLSGNVAEWTASFSFTSGEGVDYYYIGSGSFHTSDNGYVRCDEFSNVPEDEEDDDIGFRCCEDL